MNKFFYFDDDRDQQILASTAGDTWFIAKQADVTVARGAAIDASTPALDRTFIIHGLVNGLNGDGVLVGRAGQARKRSPKTM